MAQPVRTFMNMFGGGAPSGSQPDSGNFADGGKPNDPNARRVDPSMGDPNPEDGDDEISIADAMAGMFAKPARKKPNAADGDDSEDDAESDSEDDPEDGTEPPAKKRTKTLVASDADEAQFVTQLTESINKIRLPEDFDFTQLSSPDPAIQRKGFAQVQQHAVTTALQLTIPVMQRALEKMQTQNAAFVKQQLKGLKSGISEEQILTNEIPAYSDPKFKGMVEHFVGMNKQNGVDDIYKNIQLVNRFLKKMNVPMKARAASGGRDSGGARSMGMKETLENYFPTGQEK